MGHQMIQYISLSWLFNDAVGYGEYVASLLNECGAVSRMKIVGWEIKFTWEKPDSVSHLRHKFHIA
jgi:hypothetical protein